MFLSEPRQGILWSPSWSRLGTLLGCLEVLLGRPESLFSRVGADLEACLIVECLVRHLQRFRGNFGSRGARGIAGDGAGAAGGGAAGGPSRCRRRLRRWRRR